MQTLWHSALVLLTVLLVYFIGRRIVLALARKLISATSYKWDDVFLQHKVPDRLSLLLPLIAARAGLEFLSALPAPLLEWTSRLISSLMILVVAMTVSAMLAVLNTLYDRTASSGRPIKSYIQLGNVITYLVAAIFIVARLSAQSPWMLVSGIGAMMAVVLLIFRDTLLSLVAGMQLTNNDLVRVGDWIEMPQFGADGDVVDIALHTVKVQNWDKTITVIPTHKFLDNSFKNWRGMFDVGGRRIKRSIFINTATIRFLSDEELERYEKFALLRPYLATKRKELAESKVAAKTDQSVSVNVRRLTNIGTLRAYIIAYLRQHPQVHQEMTFLVRQLAPTPEGLPLEIYVFTNDTRWAVYEGIQADIFDHILAMVPEFSLRVYQRPSGHDLDSVLSEASS